MGRRAPGRDMERPLEQISPTKPLGEHASQNKTTRKIECLTSKPPPVLKELSLHHGEGHTWHRSARPLACTDRVRGPEMDLRLQPGALADGAHGVPTGDPGRGRVQQGAGACSRAREDPEGPGRIREGAGGPGRTREGAGGPGRAREDPGGPGRAREGPGGVPAACSRPRTGRTAHRWPGTGRPS